MELPGTDSLADCANKIMPLFERVIAVNFAFPPDHLSFAANHLFRQPGKTMMIDGRTQLLKPIHCVDASFGAEFPSNLNKDEIDYVQKVGTKAEIDIYSMFSDLDLSANQLYDYLERSGVKVLFFMGVGGTFFENSIHDARLKGFETILIKDAIAGDFNLPGIGCLAISEIEL
jgi:nicotinamidase/pyrazinamidase